MEEARGAPGILRTLRRVREQQQDEEVDLSRSIEGLEHDVTVQFEQLLDQHRAAKASGQPALAFYKPKPKADSLSGLVKQRARARKEQLKLDLSDDAPLRQIGFLIEEYAVQSAEDTMRSSIDSSAANLRINYDGFTQVATRCREMFGPAMSSLFKASVFQMFEQDTEGCICARHFLTYLSLRSAMVQMRVHLGRFDPENTGWLTEAQLEDFLEHWAATVSALEDMPQGFMPLYKRIAARKLLFFHGHNGRVRIKELLSSHTLGELSDLKIPNQSDEQLLGTWFSLQSTMRVHSTFQRLDEFGRGVLDLQEFSQISGSTMSQLFLERIFEEHVMTRRAPGTRGPHAHGAAKSMGGGGSTHRDKMDIIDFTDFVLAWDHRSSPAAIKYFFPIFDLRHQGKVTPYELYVFFKEIHIMWVTVLGEYPDLAIYDVVDELLDMIRPKDPPNITQEDLRVSGMSGVFFSILADAKQFRDYNYRENTMHQDDDQ